jgi:hypothetical protein
MTYESHEKLLGVLVSGDPEENERQALRHAAGWLKGWEAGRPDTGLKEAT